MKDNTLVIIMISCMVLLLFGILLMVFLTDDSDECSTRYTLENGVVCTRYFANDFGSSHAESCSDGLYYENPSNVKKTTICKDDALVSVSE